MPPPAPAPSPASPHAAEAASWPRRVLALVVDWLACLGVAETLVAYGVLASNAYSTWTIAIFVLESTLFTALLGGSFGKLATRLRVVRIDGPGPVGLVGALLRSLMIALLVPPLVFKPDGRGLHDLAAGTRTVAI